MSVTMNPAVYLQHAWNDTKSIWGKLCIILFYAFIWFNIIWALILVFVPTFGMKCFYTGQTEFANYFIASCMRGLNVFTIGFLLYADRGGIRVWNVAMVFIIYGVYLVISIKATSDLKAGMEGFSEEECPIADGWNTSFWVLAIWLILSMMFSILEHKAVGGTSGERQPLVGQNAK